VRVSRLQTEERHVLTIYDEIRQLRAELAACILSLNEREAAQAELAFSQSRQPSIASSTRCSLRRSRPNDRTLD